MSSYLNEMSLMPLGIIIPPGKTMEFFALLACWLAAVVFLIVAWSKQNGVDNAPGDETYNAVVQKKIKDFIMASSLFALFVVLTFFLVLRVAFAPGL